MEKQARLKSHQGRGFTKPRGLLLPSLRRALPLLLLAVLINLPESPGAWAASTIGLSLPIAPSPQVVYSVLSGDESDLLMASAATPAHTRLLARVQHQQGYGLRARVSPQGDRVAYLRLPPGSGDPSTLGELWALNIASGSRWRIGEGYDLFSPPLWSPGGDSVVIRQRTGGDAGFRLLTIAMETGATNPLITVPEALSGQPIGWDQQHHAFYYTVLTPLGTDVYRLDLSTREAALAFHASDGTARDFQLDAAGQRLSYTEVLPAGGPSSRVVTVDLQRQERSLMEATLGAFSPVWKKGGAGMTVGTAGTSLPYDRGSGLQVQSAREALGSAASLPGTLIAPVAWSPGGDFLAARLLLGDRPDQLKGEQLVLLAPGEGRPIQLTGGGYAEFAGWAP